MKLNVRLAMEGEEVLKLGQAYKIKDTEEFTSELKGYKGIRVILEAEDGKLLAIPLWLREQVGRKSKLGAFLALLGDNTAKWKGKKIQFVSWEQGKRIIKEAE